MRRDRVGESDVVVRMRDGVWHLASTSTGPISDEQDSRRCSPLRSTTRTSRGRTSGDAASTGLGPALDRAVEAGDTRFFVSRGYAHVIGSPRGIGKSEGGGSREWDSYDLIEWIADAALVRRSMSA